MHQQKYIIDPKASATTQIILSPQAIDDNYTWPRNSNSSIIQSKLSMSVTPEKYNSRKITAAIVSLPTKNVPLLRKMPNLSNEPKY